MVKRLGAVVVGMALALAGCGGGGGSCPNDLPASCPSPAPSYARDVAPIISANCLKCHGPGGTSPNIALGDYPSLSARRQQVLDQVYSCRMPPPSEPGLSTQDRQTLLGWLVCGAPDD